MTHRESREKHRAERALREPPAERRARRMLDQRTEKRMERARAELISEGQTAEAESRQAANESNRVCPQCTEIAVHESCREINRQEYERRKRSASFKADIGEVMVLAEARATHGVRAR